MNCKPITSCLVCGSDNLVPYLDLGEQPLANAFSGDGEKYPLGLNYCPECFHSQLTHGVDPESMFRDYAYVSGTSKTLNQYFNWFVKRVEQDFPERQLANSQGLSVLEIGSNDGSLLKEFRRLRVEESKAEGERWHGGHMVVGLDPASDIADQATFQGIVTINDFWPTERHIGGPFDVIVAMNVLAHCEDPVAFLKAMKPHLSEGGRIYLQTSQSLMLTYGEFDTVYHEHRSFFTMRSFRKLAELAGLNILSAEHVDIHGTSTLVVMGHQDKQGITEPDSFEITNGYYDPKKYRVFTDTALSTKQWTLSTVEEHRKAGFKIVGYGAAAKGTVFLNYTGLKLDYVIDDSPLKTGKTMPGTDIPILSSDRLIDEPDKLLIVILAWNFEAEIRARVARLRGETKDSFLMAFPTPKVVVQQ